jgi:retron-type reverse transcriptase
VSDVLKGIAEDLMGKEYHLNPVRRVNIPKPDGKNRLLGDTDRSRAGDPAGVPDRDRAGV